jgi:hypothetical protein
LFFLPPYSPDRNPDELVWKHLKADSVGRMAVAGKDDFQRKASSSVRQLQNDPKKFAPLSESVPKNFMISQLLTTRATSFPRKLQAI